MEILVYGYKPRQLNPALIIPNVLMSLVVPIRIARIFHLSALLMESIVYQSHLVQKQFHRLVA